MFNYKKSRKNTKSTTNNLSRWDTFHFILRKYIKFKNRKVKVIKVLKTERLKLPQKIELPFLTTKSIDE